MNEAEEFVSLVKETSRHHCPSCSPRRKKSQEKTLSVTVEGSRKLYMCHHCGLTGKVEEKPFYEKHLDKAPVDEGVITPIPTQLKTDNDLIRRFFSLRGVTLDSLDELPPMTTGTKYFNNLGEVEAIGFIYPDQAIKWRAIDHKAFTQDGAAQKFYGIESIQAGDERVIICEGEADCIALASIGIKAISVPNGAPQKVSNRKIDPEEDSKFHYVWEARDILDKAERICIIPDRDEAGAALSEEIARRVGRAKCWKVELPSDCKDITDLLKEKGADEVLSFIDNPAPFPLSGVYAASDYKEELLDTYAKGVGSGTSTGISKVDELFTIAEGQLSVVTGLPSSGKSEFIDQIMINLAKNHSWKFAVASFENPPHIHISKLAEKLVGKPYFEGSRARMTRSELNDAFDFIDKHFVFLESKDGNMPTVDSIIDRTKQAVYRLVCRGLVIDPYNYIEMESTEEHSSISKMLTMITSFCKAHSIHCWFVAHPAKMYPKEDGTYPVPKGMSISGSAAWFAKADLGVTVHRGDMGVEIHCWKSRFKWVGQQGMTTLGYDIPTGRYFDGTENEESGTDTLKVQAPPHWMDDFD